MKYRRLSSEPRPAPILKPDIVDEIYTKVPGLTKGDAERALEAFLEALAEMFERGHKLTIYGFGVFRVSDRAARPGRNLHTGAPLTIAPRRSVRFRAGLVLHGIVNDRPTPERYPRRPREPQI